MVQADLKGATHAMISRKDGPPKVHEWWEWRNAYYGDRDMDLWWEAIIQLLAEHARFAQSDVQNPVPVFSFLESPLTGCIWQLTAELSGIG